MLTVDTFNIPEALAQIPTLGVGIGFRPEFRAELLMNQSSADFLEVTADHYLNNHRIKHEELDLLKHHFTLIPHAINLSLGSAEGLDEAYLEKLAKLIDYINPPYWSEHLCFTKAQGLEIGHLAPVPFTYEAIEVFARNIEKARKYISQPLILENITYPFAIPGNQMSEAEFIRQVAETCQVGLLLDITNLYINSVNHQFDYKQFLAEIPRERVVQFHFVGGYWHQGKLVDGHAHTTNPEIWQVMDYALQATPVKGLILERDDNFPPYQELTNELSQARHLFKKYR
jgi:uncharacterized protein